MGHAARTKQSANPQTMFIQNSLIRKSYFLKTNLSSISLSSCSAHGKGREWGFLSHYTCVFRAQLLCTANIQNYASTERAESALEGAFLILIHHTGYNGEMRQEDVICHLALQILGLLWLREFQQDNQYLIEEEQTYKFHMFTMRPLPIYRINKRVLDSALFSCKKLTRSLLQACHALAFGLCKSLHIWIWANLMRH